MLAGLDADTGGGAHMPVGEEFCSEVAQDSGGWGGGEGDAQEYTRKLARKCCTDPLATYPLKEGKLSLLTVGAFLAHR